MSYIIELQDGVPRTYWSDKPDAHPLGNWGERKDAKIFAHNNDAQDYVNTYLSTQSDLCKIVPL